MEETKNKLDKILIILDKLTKRLDYFEIALNMTNDKLNKIDWNLSKRISNLENVIDQKVNVKEYNELKRKVLVLEKQHEESEYKAQIEQISKDAYSKGFSLIIHGLAENKNNPWETREETEETEKL